MGRLFVPMVTGVRPFNIIVSNVTCVTDGSINLSRKRRAGMSTTGQKPGRGTYTCTQCGERVTLDDATDTLPPCPRCNGTNFRP